MRIEIYAENIVADTVVKMERRGKSAAGKREKFRALAEARTNKAIEAILRIGNLSNRQIYDCEDAEVKKILRALKDAISSVEARFESPRGKPGGTFKL